MGQCACNTLYDAGSRIKPDSYGNIAVAPLVILANTLPVTPGGVGIAEGASAGLYALVGQAGGANGMLLTRLFIVIHALMGFPFFLFNRQVKNKISNTKVN